MEFYIGMVTVTGGCDRKQILGHKSSNKNDKIRVQLIGATINTFVLTDTVTQSVRKPAVNDKQAHFSSVAR